MIIWAISPESKIQTLSDVFKYLFSRSVEIESILGTIKTIMFFYNTNEAKQSLDVK